MVKLLLMNRVSNYYSTGDHTLEEENRAISQIHFEQLPLDISLGLLHNFMFETMNATMQFKKTRLLKKETNRRFWSE